MATMTPREQIDEVLANVTPAGRIDAIVEMQREGRITPEQAGELLEMPEMAAHIATPVGDITVRADTTLKPDEFRIESGGQVTRVIGVDFGGEPSTTVIFHKCGRCEQVLDFGDADPTEIAIMKRGHDTICPARNGVVNGVFHIEPDPPDLKDRQAAKVRERQREERDSLLSKSWESMLDEYYPRDEDGRHYLPAPSPPVNWAKIARAKSRPPYRLAEPGAGTFDYAAAFRGVDRSESPKRLSGAKIYRVVKVEHGIPVGRPDGFAQSKIDEIKAMLTAPAKGKRQ